MTQNKTSDPALMNDAQRYELRELAILHEMPFSDDLTMAEAEARLKELRKRDLPTQDTDNTPIR
ncbi:hypothetical protein [Litoreibacter arenae]|uniref:Uncharacterized protein n=1 Tax=Litoreibacter arenae DSM 19593 TaxID=1123360 RepID=S9QN36_9RHOB|nr:hypothetical protein [Litoreibacter arenae]EPX81023.1 hypothetical protein thalar_00469 [Litoreibacter arenae DSM 19593]